MEGVRMGSHTKPEVSEQYRLQTEMLEASLAVWFEGLTRGFRIAEGFLFVLPCHEDPSMATGCLLQ